VERPPAEAEECILELARVLNEEIQGLVAGEALVGEACRVQQQHGVLGLSVVRIDHMNDSSAYFKKLLGWVGELSISVRTLERRSL